MRNTKLSFIAMLAMIGVIGMAWAVFDFTDPTSNSSDIGLSLEGYTEVGDIEFVSTSYYFSSSEDTDRTGIAIDNATDMLTHYALVTVNHIYPVDGSLPENGVSYTSTPATAVFNDAALATYLTPIVSIESNWADIGGDIGKTAVYKITLEWKAGQEPTNPTEWHALNAVLQDAITAGDATITFTVTVDPII